MRIYKLDDLNTNLSQNIFVPKFCATQFNQLFIKKQKIQDGNEKLYFISLFNLGYVVMHSEENKGGLLLLNFFPYNSAERHQRGIVKEDACLLKKFTFAMKLQVNRAYKHHIHKPVILIQQAWVLRYSNDLRRDSHLSYFEPVYDNPDEHDEESHKINYDRLRKGRKGDSDN